MYTNTSSSPPRIDSVSAREGSFQVDEDGQPQITVRLAYSNKESREGWGFFDARADLLSPRTLEAFANLLRCVEEDVGQLLFSEGSLTQPNAPAEGGKAESGDGLKFKGLGEG